MSKKQAQFQLEEAFYDLGRMCDKLRTNRQYSYSDFETDMKHLYMHVNLAWNMRNVENQEIKKCNRENFIKWKAYPDDLNL